MLSIEIWCVQNQITIDNITFYHLTETCPVVKMSRGQGRPIVKEAESAAEYKYIKFADCRIFFIHMQQCQASCCKQNKTYHL